jgi:SOS-response transcriptional repressor LexA
MRPRRTEAGDPLTERQEEVMELIRAGFLRGQPPSIRELVDAMGFSGPNAIMAHLRALVLKGALVPIGSKGDARRYRPATLPCPHCGRNLYEGE